MVLPARISILIAGMIVVSVGPCALSQEIRVESEQETHAQPEITVPFDSSDLPPGLAPWVHRTPDEVIELPAFVHPPEEGRDGCDECKRLQVSVERDVPDFPTETWRHIAEERGPGSWRIVVHSPEAVFIRAQLEAERAAGPMVFFFYGANGAESLARPFSSSDVARTGGWGPIIEGEYLFIEAITGSSTSPPLLKIPQISHGYLPIPPLEQRSWCYNDVTCYPGWSDVSRAVARIYYQTGGFGGYVCTGSLLADTDPATQRFWFLTAHHCISSDPVADTLAAYFDYTTSTCDGPAPLPWDPRRFAYGSDYVVGSETSDFTLLELDENPPGYQTFLGWSTGDLASGEDIVTVHHPGGLHQRITFGNENGSVDAWPYWDDFWRVVYHSGSTEGGSSGAPLLDEAGKCVRGQLWGGTASCWNMAGIDLFGRFGVSWDLGLSDYLLAATTPPEPETTTWDTPPHAAGPDAIAMKATPATDPSGAEYSFEEMTGHPGGTDSGWQDEPEYTDDGLQSGTQYCYRVKARDTSPSLDEAGWSSTECASTSIRGDINGDGVVNLIDVLMLYRFVHGELELTPVQMASGDIDQDNDADADDAQALADIVFGP